MPLLRQISFLVALCSCTLPAFLVAQEGVEKPTISTARMVVEPIKDNVKGTLIIKNIVVTGGACFKGSRPTSYSVKLEQTWSDVRDDQTGAKYDLVYVDSDWTSDTTCNVTMALRGGPLPVKPGNVHGMAQFSIQAYVVCIEKFTAERVKKIDVNVTN